MSHTRIVGIYSALTMTMAASLGGYVACGAPSYRVPVHGEAGGSSVSSGREAGSPGSSGDGSMSQGATSLLGVHSQDGWSKTGPINFYTSSDMPQATVQQLRLAMETWEKAVGKKLFVYMGEEQRKGADFSSLYAPLNDNVNGHYFDFSWSLATGKSTSVLATTIWENSPNDPQSIVKADIRYNAESYIFGDALREFGRGSRIIVDLESLSLHELGHLLGLSHVSTDEDRYSVMNPSLFIGEGMSTRNLSRGDIDRIRSIYGVGDANAVDALEIADDSSSQ